jgi:hypothetical protein
MERLAASEVAEFPVNSRISVTLESRKLSKDVKGHKMDPTKISNPAELGLLNWFLILRQLHVHHFLTDTRLVRWLSCHPLQKIIKTYFPN